MTDDRCQVCMRTCLVTFRCRCEGVFCRRHRLPEGGHACTFDYRAAGARTLRRDNPRIEPDKLPTRLKSPPKDGADEDSSNAERE